MKKLLFIDRDGTLVLEPEDYQVDSFQKLKFYPQVFTYLSKTLIFFHLILSKNS